MSEFIFTDKILEKKCCDETWKQACEHFMPKITEKHEKILEQANEIKELKTKLRAERLRVEGYKMAIKNQKAGVLK